VEGCEGKTIGMPMATTIVMGERGGGERRTGTKKKKRTNEKIMKKARSIISSNDPSLSQCFQSSNDGISAMQRELGVA